MNDNVVPLRRKTDPPPEPGLAPASRQAALLLLLAAQGKKGMNWIDVSAQMGLHHGAASGLLSTLHREGKIARLQEKRDNCSVYVLPPYVNGRHTLPYRVNQKALVDQMATALRRFARPCRHPQHDPHPTCRYCEARNLLQQYDSYRSSH